MIEIDGTSRFSTLDGDKYGKMSIQMFIYSENYSEGIVIVSSYLNSLTHVEKINNINKTSKMLSGGLLIKVKFDREAKIDDIKKGLEKAADLVGTFRPSKDVPICGNCGFKDEKLSDKCPTCKSPYILN